MTGSVVYNGKPLAQGTIIFEPTTGRPANGEIKDGKILNVTTFDPGDGAVIGTHRVAIQAAGSGDMYAPQKELIPQRYTSIDKSGLTAGIKAGENDLTFTLTD